MNPEKQVEDLLQQDGATLVREHKHRVWQLSNGAKFTQSSTPSDFRAAHNQLTDLRRALNVDIPDRGAPGERREHKPHNGRVEPVVIHPAGRASATFEEALRASGAVEVALRTTINAQRAVLEQQSAAISRLRAEMISQVEQKMSLRCQVRWFAEHRCAWCALKLWIERWWRRRRG